jgi:integrase
MKAVAKHIMSHTGGHLYFRARVAGKIVTRSLGTKDLGEAKQLLLEKGYAGIIERKAEQSAVKVLQAVSAPTVTLKSALDQHDMRMVKDSEATQEMASRSRKAVERYTSELVDFSPVAVWTNYRQKGLKGKPVTSAANHLRWYLGSFVSFGVERGFLLPAVTEEFKKVPSIQISPRRIRVPEVLAVKELLEMVATEDEEGADFFRFLAASGVRKAGALGLEWKRIDMDARSMEVKMKSRGGSRWIVLPMTPEALGILRKREGLKLPSPWPFLEARVRSAGRVLKKFAKGMNIDLKDNHAFRHYFASQALAGGLSVPEVASLLGHKDGGALVLRVYGHLLSGRLKTAVAGLRLFS